MLAAVSSSHTLSSETIRTWQGERERESQQVLKDVRKSFEEWDHGGCVYGVLFDRTFPEYANFRTCNMMSLEMPLIWMHCLEASSNPEVNIARK